jgi:tetratricopeptide (TPR) repeat protein
MDRSVELLSAAVRLDPALSHATLFLALALASQNREMEARQYFERAILLDRYPPIALAYYADALAKLSHFSEAERLFQKAIKRNDTCVIAIRDYGNCLIRENNPEADNNIERAVNLLERALDLDPTDAESHHCLGCVLPSIDGQVERAIGHLERAIAIDPTHTRAIKTLEDVKAWRDSDDED